MKYLQNINNPDDLKKLSLDQLEDVCVDLREFIIEQLSNNPGHFGSLIQRKVNMIPLLLDMHPLQYLQH